MLPQLFKKTLLLTSLLPGALSLVKFELRGDSTDPAAILNGTRSEDILANITGIYDLPLVDQVLQNATLNATNIQGDILVGMKKKLELFYFFEINNPKSFKSKLHTDVVPRITNTLQLLSVSTQPIVALNLAFSQTGLSTLGITDDLGDAPFAAGQAADADNLGDPGTTNWIQAFAGTKIHGVFLIASDTDANINAQVSVLESLFGNDITNIHSLQGAIRPPPYDGHEMFGYLDGISQPAVVGFNVNPEPGQQIVLPGVILAGELGDTQIASRPAWAKDGSFLAFRQLKQLVPEFEKFVFDNAPPVVGLTQDQSADLLGARMVGRWKSGAPVDLTPMVDDPALGADPHRNNDFNYLHVGFSPLSDQSHCPFAAHIRKGFPRSDLPTPLNAIMRSGIPYGPEVTDEERANNASDPAEENERGLAFVAYQSRIDFGFQFIQTRWANTETFPPGKLSTPGFDAIIGANHGQSRTMGGYDVDDTTRELTLLQDFVVSKGGEYFFSPSIEALRDVISV